MARNFDITTIIKENLYQGLQWKKEFSPIDHVWKKLTDAALEVEFVQSYPVHHFTVLIKKMFFYLAVSGEKIKKCFCIIIEHTWCSRTAAIFTQKIRTKCKKKKKTHTKQQQTEEVKKK